MDYPIENLKSLLMEDNDYSKEKLKELLKLDLDTDNDLYSTFLLLLEKEIKILSIINIELLIYITDYLPKLFKESAGVIGGVVLKKLKIIKNNLDNFLMNNNIKEPFLSNICNLLKHLDKTIVFFEFRREFEVSHTNGYGYFSFLIFNVKDIEQIKGTIKIYPKIACIKDCDNDNIFERVLHYYTYLVNMSYRTNIDDITYFDSVIDEMIKSPYCYSKELKDKIISEIDIMIISIKSKQVSKIEKNEMKLALIRLREKLRNNLQPNFCSYEEVNKRYNKSFVFPNEVLNKATLIKGTPDKKFNTVDMTKLFTISIDSRICSDIDDAFSFEEKSNGNYVIYVHITNVSKYVHMNSIIDFEAFKRIENIYTNNKTLTMLPFNLCNNLTSLLPNVRRNAITCIFEFDSHGIYIDDSFDIKYGQIISKRRLSCKEADDILLNSEDDSYLSKALKLLSLLSFNIKGDAKIEINDNSLKNFSELRNRIGGKNNITVNTVNELMTFTNMQIPNIFSQRGLPFLYRAKDTYMLKAMKKGLLSFPEIMSGNSKEELELQILKTKFIESLTNGTYYSAEDKPHRGLRKNRYCKATSPNREYSGLYIQYLLWYLYFNNPSDKTVYYFKQDTERVAKHLNSQEQSNVEYARELNRVKKYL